MYKHLRCREVFWKTRIDLLTANIQAPRRLIKTKALTSSSFHNHCSTSETDGTSHVCTGVCSHNERDSSFQRKELAARIPAHADILRLVWCGVAPIKPQLVDQPLVCGASGPSRVFKRCKGPASIVLETCTSPLAHSQRSMLPSATQRKVRGCPPSRAVRFLSFPGQGPRAPSDSRIRCSGCSSRAGPPTHKHFVLKIETTVN